MSLLALDQVACGRGGRTLFEGVSLTLGPGDAAVVTGPNGAGKSSLLRIAAGLLAPVAGTVRATARRALLAEQAALDGDRTVGAALLFWASLDDRPSPSDRVGAALAAVGLAPLVDVPVRLLSTGQRRRIAFARVLTSEASVWLLDEPTNGLDVAAIGRLEDIVARHRADGGCVLVATHQPIDLPGAAAIAIPDIAT